MKINEIISQPRKPAAMEDSSSSSGAVSTMAMPIGSMIKRSSIFPAPSAPTKKKKKSK